MKRLTHSALGLALLGYLTGYSASPRAPMRAQTPAAQTQAGQSRQGPSYQSTIPATPLNQPIPMWPNQPKDATHWSIDDIRKAHATLAAAAAAGRTMDPNSALHDMPYWSRTHSLFIIHRPHYARPRPSNVAKTVSQWEDAEQHAGYAQFIVIMGGSGSIVAGGQIRNAVSLSEKGRQLPGEYRGQPVAGGETFRVKEGDWVSIPANVPAWFQPDTGGLTYMAMKVNAMLYPWELIR